MSAQAALAPAKAGATQIEPEYKPQESRGSALVVDDNPDITHYLGYGDVTALYTFGKHTLSLLARYNPATGKGALQAGWNFPLHRKVRGYVQWFSGYGESMIDYNWRQNTIGIGVSLSDAL